MTVSPTATLQSLFVHSRIILYSCSVRNAVSIRVDVSIRQELGLKQCAPDDLCDMCEGSTWHVGNGYKLEPKLEPVRFTPRFRQFSVRFPLVSIVLDSTLRHPSLCQVRSAVRENVLWAAVQLCTHELKHEHGALALVAALSQVCETDTNVCSIGYAMDCLHRLQLRSSVRAEARAALDSAHSQLTVRCPETLARTNPPVSTQATITTS